MKIGKIELDDWTVITTGEPVRYSVNYRQKIGAHIVLWREYIDDEIYRWAWRPRFSHDLYFLDEVFQKSYGIHIKGTAEIAKECVDNFLRQVERLKAFA